MNKMTKITNSPVMKKNIGSTTFMDSGITSEVRFKIIENVC